MTSLKGSDMYLPTSRRRGLIAAALAVLLPAAALAAPDASLQTVVAPAFAAVRTAFTIC